MHTNNILWEPLAKYDSIAPAVDQDIVKINFVDFHAKMYDVSESLAQGQWFKYMGWNKSWALMMQVATGPCSVPKRKLLKFLSAIK